MNQVFKACSHLALHEQELYFKSKGWTNWLSN